MIHKITSKFPPEARMWAARLVRDHKGEFSATSSAMPIGCEPGGLVPAASRLGIVACIAFLAGCKSSSSLPPPSFALKNIYTPTRSLPDAQKFASAGQYEIAATASIDGYTALHAKMQLDNPQTSTIWAPMCRVGLRNDLNTTPAGGFDESRSPHRIGIDLLPTISPNLGVTVISGIAHPATTTFALRESLPAGDPVDLTISWLNGQLIVEVNGAPPVSVNYKWPISALALTAANARCRFSELSLGNIVHN